MYGGKLSKLKSKLAEISGQIDDSDARKADHKCNLIEAQARLEKAESSASSIKRRIKLLEKELSVEARCEGIEDRLEELGSEGSKPVEIVPRESPGGNKIARLERELADLNKRIATTGERFEEVQQALSESEEALDTQDERTEAAGTRVKELEAEVTQVGNSLRSMEICEKEGVNRTEGGSSKVTDMNIKLEEMNDKATNFEAKASELEQVGDDLSEKLDAARDIYNATKQEYDSMLAELAEI